MFRWITQNSKNCFVLPNPVCDTHKTGLVHEVYLRLHLQDWVWHGHWLSQGQSTRRAICKGIWNYKWGLFRQVHGPSLEAQTRLQHWVGGQISQECQGGGRIHIQCHQDKESRVRGLEECGDGRVFQPGAFCILSSIPFTALMTSWIWVELCHRFSDFTLLMNCKVSRI